MPIPNQNFRIHKPKDKKAINCCIMASIRMILFHASYFADMTDEERKLVEEKIDKKIEKTLRDLEEYKELTKPIAPENAIGRLSRMEAINSKSVVEAAYREAQAKLKNLEHMKNRLDDPDFGKCAKCQKEIPIQRLLFRPSSRFCVNCAQ